MSATKGAKPRITVLGSANMDLVTRTERLPAPGETLLGRSFTAAPGGKGSNKAIAAARAGGDVEFVGAVGDDTFALDLREILVLNDVGTSLLREVEGPSGVAAIGVDDSGENCIVVVGGANSTITELTDAELAAVADADILLLDLELPLAAILAGAQHAHANDTTVILNPSPVQELPDELLAAVDILVLNKAEAELLGAHVLAAVPHVVITLGVDGATYRGPGGAAESVPALPVDVVDTTGAGDAFAGVLAVAWQRGPAEALRWACAAGGLASTVAGASPSLPQRADIARALAETIAS
ncbi:ribokinase [Antrihabitans cavernicola]|uniref:Ribokinase n=1 Tax=Antrihabitans cavernicola TaxID=2495913 RepID=A0A5A7S9U0_9NOCA|nr:ribokinase [Spelaeibacter cavernicola]KAA0022948.1 ribokinase [Spelaeibacter cavernicola]